MKDGQAGGDERATWDWITVMVVALAVILLLIVTFELWIPHPFDSH